MQSQNKFFDDLAKVLNGAAGTVAGMAREGADGARERAREWMGGLDFVSRDEFETVRDMLSAARADIDALKARLDAAEGGAAPTAAPAASKARKPKP